MFICDRLMVVCVLAVTIDGTSLVKRYVVAVVVTAAFAQGWHRGSYEMGGIRGSGGCSGCVVRDCDSGDGIFARWWFLVRALAVIET